MWVEKLPVKELDQFCVYVRSNRREVGIRIQRAHSGEYYEVNNVSSPLSFSFLRLSLSFRMAHNNNPIVRNKTLLQDILSADPQFILHKVREKELITGREYLKINSINMGDAEDLVIKLVDTLNNKGVQRLSLFIEVLQDEIVLETFPRLGDVEWGGSGTASSSSSKRPAETSLSKGK